MISGEHGHAKNHDRYPQRRGRDRRSRIPPPARRAWEKFKRDVQKLPLRLAHALDLGCKVVPSSKGSKQAYLSKLSQDKMDPLATFRGLIDLSESEKHGSFGDGKIDKKQAYRLLKNLKAHGEMITTLQKQIDDMGTSDSLNHHETKLLNFLKRLKGNHKSILRSIPPTSVQHR